MPIFTNGSPPDAIYMQGGPVDAIYMQGEKLWPLVMAAVEYDATGAGGYKGTTGTTLSWSHTAAGTDGAVVVGVYGYNNSSVLTEISSVTYGGTPMTLVGGPVRPDANGRNNLSVYVLLNPLPGPRTVTVTTPFAGNILRGNSISYSGVGGYSSPSHNSGSGSPLSVSVPSANGHMAVHVSGGPAYQLASFTGTLRHNEFYFHMGDAPGDATVNFEGGWFAGGNWGAVGIDLIPA